MQEEKKCQYKNWTESVNGIPTKMQGCYPGSQLGSCKGYTEIKCKYPNCL